MNFTYKDKENIKNYYESFLQNLKYQLKQNNNDLLTIVSTIMKCIQEGRFSIDESFKLDTKYNYIMLPSEISNGVHITLGISCCRHVNTFLYDILKELDYSPSLIYIFIDENNEWHMSAAKDANHLAVLVKYQEKEYICDVANNFISQIINNDLISQKLNYECSLEYFEDENINEITKILKKYYQYRSLGIKRIYD